MRWMSCLAGGSVGKLDELKDELGKLHELNEELGKLEEFKDKLESWMR